MILVKDVKKIYELEKSQVVALDSVDMTIQKGEFAALKGPSGCGKTTLLNLIGALDIPTGGDIIIEDQNIAVMNKKKRLQFRAKNLGFIFQDFNLIPELTVYENVEIPLLISGIRHKKEKVMKVIEEVGLATHVHHRPGELSGGQRQRVSIARALVKEPPLILADEPTANLDSKTGQSIIELIQRLNKSHGITFIVATHDHFILEKIDRVIPMMDGRIMN